MSAPFALRVKRVLLRAGFDVARLANSNSQLGIALRLIRRCRPTLLLDVGANIGQFATEILALTSGIRVVSFEPLSKAHAQLTRHSGNEPRWIVAPRMGLGSAEGVAILNVSGNFESSSILQMREAHLRAAPQSTYVSTEQIPIKRLDSVAEEYCRPQDRIYLKVDTQGYESEVIAGASLIMNRVVAIQLELSLVELYADQKLAFAMIQEIEKVGFKLFGLSNEFQDPASGELLQVNAHFIRAA